MLIFPRKPTEKIIVSDDIIISIISIKKDNVKFVLDAPQFILDAVMKEEEIYKKHNFPIPKNRFIRREKRIKKRGKNRKIYKIEE